jgi:hypothetical protein
MKVNAYNPANGTLLAEGVQGLYFGNVRAGRHCDTPILIKPIKTTESSFSDMKLFLQSNGGLAASQFGYFASGEFATGVDYTTCLTGHFDLATGVTGTAFAEVPGLDIAIVSGQPADFVWLDMQPGASEIGSTSSINYRFVFDYT